MLKLIVRKMMKQAGKFLVVCVLAMSMLACESSQNQAPEPHLELGQRVSFVGSEPEKTYVVVGYRQLLEDKTEKQWSDHAYIVVSYINNQGDLKNGVVHRNAILKR